MTCEMKEKKDNGQPGVTDKPAQHKVLIFKIIGISLPFLLLVLLEVSLRLFHYGNSLDLFIPYPANNDYLVFNPHASLKYFTDPAFATTGNIELFGKKKDANTCRIFVLGESTTIGYPYFYNASFHRWLHYRLMRTYPEKNFEIINLSLTAVNSYAIRGFAKEVANYEPDAVLIYVGHNEYYGAQGVGSTQSIGGNPVLVNFALELRQFRTMQLMTNWYRKITGLFIHHMVEVDATRMELMVASQQIPYQSNLFQRGINQFKSNIDATLRIFGKKNIPVFISNLVSNEKDLPPFVSAQDAEPLPVAFITKYDQGLKALANKDSASAQSLFLEANQIFPRHALCNFYLGQLTYHQGDFRNAKDYFDKAREFDLLRLRAPEELNQAIAEFCRQFKNVHLVNTKAMFEQQSPHQIIGNELIIDHVHPNLLGYSLISDIFYNALKTEHILPEQSSTKMSYAQLVKEMPITKVDSLSGIFRIHNLKSHWPFNDPQYKTELPVSNEEEKLAQKMALKQIGWKAANDSLYAYYVQNHRLEEAGKINEAMVLENPIDPAFNEKSAMMSGELKNYEKAVFYFTRSFRLSPSFKKAKYLFVILLKADQTEKAKPFLDYAIANNSAGLNLKPIKAVVETVIELQKKLVVNSSDVAVLNQIAEAYLKMDNRDGAQKYIDQVLKLDAKNKEAQSMLKQLNQKNNGSR